MTLAVDTPESARVVRDNLELDRRSEDRISHALPFDNLENVRRLRQIEVDAQLAAMEYAFRPRRINYCKFPSRTGRGLIVDMSRAVDDSVITKDVGVHYENHIFAQIGRLDEGKIGIDPEKTDPETLEHLAGVGREVYLQRVAEEESGSTLFEKIS